MARWAEGFGVVVLQGIGALVALNVCAAPLTPEPIRTAALFLAPGLVVVAVRYVMLLRDTR